MRTIKRILGWLIIVAFLTAYIASFVMMYGWVIGLAIPFGSALGAWLIVLAVGWMIDP